MIKLNPNPIELDGFLPARCLQPLDDALIGREERGFCVRLGGKLWFCPEGNVLRADAIGAYRLYRGAHYALAYHGYDQAVFARCGFDTGWAGNLQMNNEAMFRRWRGQKAGTALLDLDRHGAPSVQERVDRALGRALTLAQSGGLSWAFNIPFADRQSRKDKEEALIQFNTRAADPRVTGRLAGCGVTADMLAELNALEGTLHKEIGEEAQREARAAQDTLPLRLEKGMVYGDLSMLSLTARAELKETRWEFYQLGYLFERADRAAPDPIAPVDPTPPDPTPAGPVAGPALPTPPGPAPGPGDFVLPPPGTVIRTLPGKDGPPVSAVLQPDGTVAWVVGTEPPPSPPASARPASGRRQRR